MTKLIEAAEIANHLGGRDFSSLAPKINKKMQDDSHIKSFIDKHQAKATDKTKDKNVEAQIVNGFIKIDNGDSKSAVDDFSKAIKLDKANAMAYLGRGISYVNTLKFGDAWKDLDKATNLGSNSAFAYLYLGYAKESLEETYSAIDDYETSVEINPKITEVCNTIGTIYTYLKEHETALDYYNAEIDINKNDIYARKNRAETTFYLDDYKVALIDASFVLTTEVANTKNNINYHYIRGACNIALDKEENYQQVADDMTTVIEYEPQNADAYALRGLIKYELSGAEEAKQDFIAALNIYAWHKLAKLAMKKLGCSID